MLKLDLVERGIRRVKALQPGSRPRLPVTPSILRQLRALWSQSVHDYDVILTWAACYTAFFGFFRIGELTEQSMRSCSGVVVTATDGRVSGYAGIPLHGEDSFASIEDRSIWERH